MSLFIELKRRNVFRVAIAYLAAAWLLIEVAGTLFPGFGIPDWAFRFVVIVLAIGFLPALIFSWAYELTPEGLKREKEVVGDVSTTHLTAKRLDTITISLVVLALAFITADRLWLSTELSQQAEPPIAGVSEPGRSAETGAAKPPDLSNSIAVLPFVNMSPDPDQEYFSDGISEELLNLLAKIPELRVISRSSAFAFKGEKISIPEVANKLNVTYVLEGSIRKAGDQVRITAQLIEARSDTHLWSETYDRELVNIFAVQDEIAGAVVDALKLTLLGEAPQTEPINPEAYTLYLQAAHIGTDFTEDALERSNALLKRALAIAPDYARAWRLLARNYSVQTKNDLLPRDEGNALAREAITQALTIDPNLAEAHSWLAVWEAGNGGDLTESAQRLERALRLEPNNLLVIGHAAGFLNTLGRLHEAIAIREYQLSLDPLNPIVQNNLAWSYLAAGQPDKAIAMVRTLQVLSPNDDRVYSVLCWALLFKGDYNGALQAIQEEPKEYDRLYGLVTVYHEMGRSAEADSIQEEYIEKYGQRRPYSIASILAYRGEVDRSFTWLDKASSYMNPPYWVVDKMWFANLYDDPRWLTFLESIGRSPAQLDAIELNVTLPK